jgi:2-phosphoglycerate kinase
MPPASIAEDVKVTYGPSALPFSKGVLAQSLLATAIDPVQAFDLARVIEGELRAAGVREIGRAELRAHTRQVLEASVGPDVADRYLLWRAHQEPDRPVVLLVGGTSGVGKSSLAVEVARRLGIARVLSTDSIRQIMRIMTSPRLVPALYGSSYDAWKRLARDGKRAPGVIDGFRAQASAVSVGIQASVDRTIAESANLVIDGVSIVPGAIDLEPYAETAHVITLLVGVFDEEALRRRFVIRAGGQKGRLADRYLENIEAILEIQQYLVERAERFAVPVVDNVTFEASVRRIIDLATLALRAAREQAEGCGARPPGGTESGSAVEIVARG